MIGASGHSLKGFSFWGESAPIVGFMPLYLKMQIYERVTQVICLHLGQEQAGFSVPFLKTACSGGCELQNKIGILVSEGGMCVRQVCTVF